MDNQTEASPRMTPVLADYIDIEQAARELGVARRTLTRWQTEGVAPPSVKLGTRRLFKRATIIAWLEKKETPSGSRRRGR
jgi:excisionase family DNA binding protein